MMMSLTVGLFLSAGSLLAQEYQGRGEGTKPDPQQVTEHMSQKLNLNEDQKNKVLEINQRYQKQMEENKQKDRQEMHQLHQKRSEEIKAVLTPEQQAEYEKMQKKAAKKLRKVQRGQF